ncbi:hypothetical protein C8R43DRAFT_891932 [Mycena crocata]|nr:hypothetical protein C8R43DRAFT_891932 [Mycena crocata]
MTFFDSSDSGFDSAASSPRKSPVHAASLVDPATHSPALVELIDIQLTKPVIDYVVDCVSETVDFAMGRTPASPALQSTATRGRPTHRTPTQYTSKFTTFVSLVLSRAEVTTPTVLTALVYIARARPHLSIALEEWALERVFLGALITASKYTNDSTLKNVHWALCTGVFGKRDVGRIEREFLDVLDWELGVKEADLLAHHEGLVAASKPSVSPASAIKSEILAVPRPRTHTRNHTRTSCPELEPSSPHSSDASMSPRTPASSPPSAPPRTTSYHKATPKDVPMELHPSLTVPHKTSHSKNKLHDLFRAFPARCANSRHHPVRVA